MQLRLAALACGLMLGAIEAEACTNPLSINVGTSQNFGMTLDGSSNCYSNIAIVDGTNAGSKATVSGGNLNVTVVGAFPAGTAKIGQFAVDQTTPGTTNAVQATNFPTGLTATLNALDVNIKSSSGTVTVGGTVSVTGVATAANQTGVQGAIGGGAAPSAMNVAGGQYNATPLTLSNLNVAALQLGPSGGLIVDPTNLTTSQGSTTASSRGSLMMAAVTSAVPSYATAQNNFMSLTPAGALRIDHSTVAGTTVDTNSGNLSAGTQRMVLATNQPNFTTPLNERPTDGANAAVWKASGAGAATTDPAMVMAQSPNPTIVCPSVKPISITANTDLLTSTNSIYICSLDLAIAGAETVSIVEGTGSTCGTGTAALWGGTTAAGGMPFSANGGFSKTSDRPFAKTLTPADHLCILKSGATQLSGSMWYVDHI